MPENEISDGSEPETSFSGEQLWYGEYLPDVQEIEEPIETPKKCIEVGDTLPYGARMYKGSETVFRIKDVGVKCRILIVGVIGSFTPFCWNHHLLQIITRLRYYEERGIDYICCISTNDSYTQTAWAMHLGCYGKILMIGDSKKNFTKAIGMDIVVPFLDQNIRSKRYVIYAEDMVVTKMLVADDDSIPKKWACEHIIGTAEETEESDESDSGSGSWV